MVLEENQNETDSAEPSSPSPITSPAERVDETVSAEPSAPSPITNSAERVDDADDVVSSEEIISKDAINDVALWPQVIRDNHRIILLDHGPVQIVNFVYPTNSNNRSFSDIYYKKKLPNNEIVKRDWLVYSKSTDSAYCFYCKLFNTDVNAFNDKIGYKDWQHLTRSIERHEKSGGHLMSVKNCLNLRTDISKGKTIDSENQMIIEREKKRWVAVIERLIHLIYFLARQCIALRGTSAKLFDPNNGNFLKLIESVSNFDDILNEHISRIQKSQNRMTHYLGHNIQNEIVTLVGEKIKKTIILDLKQSKYYSIILDCTTDVAHVEQITIVVRFVFLNASTRKVEVREHFLGFVPITYTTGEQLMTFLLEYLSSCDIDLQDMRGQGYDNGANMRGKNIGLQKRILNINPRAFFIPCAAHSLNLVVNDAAKCSLEISNFFSIVQEIYVFFAASTARWQLLINEMPSLTLKPLSTTRWESRVDALRALRFNLGKVYDALYKIYCDNTRDSDTRNTANSLISKLMSFKFICSIVIWYDILSKINIVSKALQKSDVILSVAATMLNKVKDELTEIRSESAFREMVTTAKTVAEEVNAATVTVFPETTRPRARRRMFDYEAVDEPITDPETHFKVHFYYYLLDTAINQFSERFKLLNDSNTDFSFLQNLQNWSDFDAQQKKTLCNNLQNKLSNGLNSDINKDDLFDEINILPLFVSDCTTPLVILDYLLANNLISLFPNLSTAIRIYLTLPVTVAQGERSFSKLKLIKNYLRSTLSQNNLTNLAIISIEHDIKIETREIVNDFAARKARKINLV